MEETARTFELSVEEAKELIEGCKMRLAEVREKRPRPHRDDKVITAWNGTTNLFVVICTEIVRFDDLVAGRCVPGLQEQIVSRDG